MKPTSLQDLEQDVARDLTLIEYPSAPWVPRRTDGKAVLDVLIVGGGQGGLTIASYLLRQQVKNILVVDESRAGEEGLWTRFARMHTLRTAKTIGGPDLGIPSLTFRAWYEAQHGAAAFERIKYIAKEDWQAYLIWFRKILALPVRNETRFLGVHPDGDLLAVRLAQADGERTVLTRKLVLAGGIETSGVWWMPPEIEALPKALRAHTADAIDFKALKGKRVIVVGAAASAFDNAATALEHGASVRMLCRRADLQRVQPYKVLAFPGFLQDFGTLPDADRWSMMHYLLNVREALTVETWERTTRHTNFELITSAGVRGASAQNGVARLDTARGAFEADFVICGTGFDMNLGARPELVGVAEHVATWADRYKPPQDEMSERLGRYPYLDSGMAFVEKTPGMAPWVTNIYCFNFGATLSFGPSGSSISALKYAAPRLARSIIADLFRADFAAHRAMIRNYATPEFEFIFARDIAVSATG
jgi:cation diffusion facilitator CzcD-associated flavoprotein CzcO